MPKFFTYSQNNSGGGFDHEPADGIGYLVCIEAYDAESANDRAKRIGLYFDGCATGADCECCGDRWSPAWGDAGEDTPQHYGRPIAGGWGLPSYIHYLDGRIEEVPAK